ncbi:MAG TPA: phage terminase large subunit [Candidatus Fimihabitans intestinipullorum]|uniref:Phage terminase large subunit n=1 Tax=Candidatus Fimihabitans intestinipullorum TaxID=2840820 RepID=A0A9D1L2L0_9BACT|nr:phage terminase large subunit [Candidatus Fimihabitans intestinipullorum]
MSIRNELKKELCRREYSDYVEFVHEGRWIKGKAVSYICDKVQEFIEADTGHAFDILVLSIPPQHGKSMTITETLPSWYLGKFPTKRIIEASYSEDFAQLFGRRNLRKIEQFGKELFNIEKGNIANNTEFELSNGIGGMISRGILSGVTGRPADLMIIDDPVKNRQEADSKTYRDRVWAEWNDSFKSRLSFGAKVIIIQTRWHEDDFAGRIIKNEKHVTVINLKCEADNNDPLGRKPGEALCPEIGKGNEWLKDFKSTFTTKEGSRTWNALYQGSPTPDDGNIFKRKWFKYYEKLPTLPYMLISVDATFKDKEDNDFVSIQVWGKRNSDFYLIDRVKEHFGFTETLNVIRQLRNKYNKCSAVLIEDKANGSAIVEVLQREFSGIIPINPEGGKIARANAVSPSFESGNVYFPKNKQWLYDYETELVSFPNAEHDDDVDCTTQAVNRLRNITAIEMSEEQKELYEYEQKKYRQKVKVIAGNTATRSFINY